MKKHTKTFLDFYNLHGYDIYIPCMICGNPSVDIQHIEPRGMGGKNKAAEHIRNYLSCCRECHVEMESKRISKDLQKEIVNKCVDMKQIIPYRSW